MIWKSTLAPALTHSTAFDVNYDVPLAYPLFNGEMLHIRASERARAHFCVSVHLFTHTHAQHLQLKDRLQFRETRNPLIRCGTLKIVHFRLLIQFRFTFETFIHASELFCALSIPPHLPLSLFLLCIPFVSMSVILFQCMFKHGTYQGIPIYFTISTYVDTHTHTHKHYVVPISLFYWITCKWGFKLLQNGIKASPDHIHFVYSVVRKKGVSKHAIQPIWRRFMKNHKFDAKNGNKCSETVVCTISDKHQTFWFVRWCIYFCLVLSPSFCVQFLFLFFFCFRRRENNLRKMMIS